MAQTEYLKQYKKDHKDKVAEWNKKYQDAHKEELALKRQLKTRQAQHAKLVALITEYVEGATLVDLEDKYIVRLRKGEPINGRKSQFHRRIQTEN